MPLTIHKFFNIKEHWMPIIKVWCLPDNQSEEDLRKLHKTIVAAVVGVRELELNDQNDMTCLFPADLMKYGLGEEIIIEVTGLFERPERTDKVRQRLAMRLGKAVLTIYPKAKVECLVETFNPQRGFWTSANTPSTAIITDKEWQEIEKLASNSQSQPRFVAALRGGNNVPMKAHPLINWSSIQNLNAKLRRVHLKLRVTSLRKGSHGLNFYDRDYYIGRVL